MRSLPAAGGDCATCRPRSPNAGRTSLNTSSNGNTSAVRESDRKNPRRVNGKAGISFGCAGDLRGCIPFIEYNEEPDSEAVVARPTHVGRDNLSACLPCGFNGGGLALGRQFLFFQILTASTQSDPAHSCLRRLRNRQRGCILRLPKRRCAPVGCTCNTYNKNPADNS